MLDKYLNDYIWQNFVISFQIYDFSNNAKKKPDSKLHADSWNINIFVGQICLSVRPPACVSQLAYVKTTLMLLLYDLCHTYDIHDNANVARKIVLDFVSCVLLVSKISFN